MAYSSRTYTPGSSTTTFALTTSGGSPIGYIRESDIEVKVNGSVQAANTYSFSGTKTVEQPSGGSIVLNSGVTGTVILARTTAFQDATVVYTAGSTLTSDDLNNADNQIRFSLQEFSDDYSSLLGTGGNLTNLASFIGASDTWVSNDAKAATTGAIDARVDAKTASKVKDDIIATAPVSIADDTPSSGKITVSVDAKLTELATMDQNTANSLADLTQTEVQILDGATLTTTELNYVDGVTSAVQTQIDGKQASDAQLTELATMGSTTAEALADLTQAEVQILDGATVSTTELNVLDGVTATTGELNILDGVTSTATELNILDGVTATTAEINYVDGVTSNVQTQLDAKQPLDADLTTLAGMQSATASILAGGTALTSTLTELNQLDGKTLGETSLTTNSDTAIPTSKAVNDRILTVTNALGGFVAIDNEVSFPNTHPDPGEGAGTVVSIADVGGLVVNSSGVATNAATVGGTAVTINGIATNFRSTTMTAGVGMQVQTTSTLNTYTYHKAILRDADISSISTDLDDFANRYRVGSSDPGSANDEGDLFFNTSSNTMKVYDGSSWGEVTSTGDFKFLFLCPTGGSGAPTIDGSIDTYDLREGTNSGTGASVTNAAQLIVSVNGVVQKANTGTSTSGLDGFVMTDANTIKFAANLPNGADVFVIQIGSAVTLNAPANNTVSTDVLQNGAVTNVKIADDNIAEVKLDIHNAPSGTDKFLKYTSNGMEWVVPSYTTNTNILAGGTITGDVVFDNATHAGDDLTWDMSDKALEFDDNVKATFGDGSDLQIYSNGSTSIIDSTNQNLDIQGSAVINIKPGDAAGIVAWNAGAVELHYNAVKEIATKSGGVKLFGHSESIVTALTSAASLTIDFSLSNHFSCTMGHNITFNNPTTESVGQSGTIVLTQDGTGSRTASWGSQFLWPGGTAPTLSTGANAVDRIDYFVAAADKIHCVASLGMA